MATPCLSSNRHLPVVTTKQMILAEKRARSRFGISEAVLMENAGRSVAESVLGILRPRRRRSSLVVVAGPGNNGGDGFVAARHLAFAGEKVEVIFAGSERTLSVIAATNLAILRACGIPVLRAARLPNSDQSRRLRRADIVVDALFGTGLSRPIRPPYSGLIERMNQDAGTIVAVDIPSGLDSDTGEVLGVAIHARYTVALGAIKRGVTTRTARRFCGRISIGRISLPPGSLPRKRR
ncbi:MAG: NAD(P)H-hydrate epimerase [Candidatus Omnitrophica bacterium]|nr:NAD(P)H-hydrate epimerase [Candidatus Omnitrophota bacterium]